MMNEYQYLYDGILNQLKETATTTFNLFSHAYELLNEDLDKSEKEFKDLIIQGEYVLKSMPFYNDKFINIKETDDLFYVIQILSLIIKAEHNLVVINRHNKLEENIPYYLGLKSYYQGELYFYYQLMIYKGIDEKTKTIIDLYYKEAKFENVHLLIGDMLYIIFMKEHHKVIDKNISLNEDDINSLREINNKEINSVLDRYNSLSNS